MTRDEAIEFLATGTRTGKLATVRHDGRPHVVPVWFVVEGDHILFTTWHETVKARSLTADPRVALTVDLQEPPYAFVLVEGEILIERESADLVRVSTRIARRYMGADRAEEYGRRNGVPGEWLIRLPMTRIVARHEIAA